jgi:Flp pilus assembly protein CpaB
LAALVADGYRSRVEAQLGELRPVLVATRDLPPGRAIDPRTARGALAVRQVPVRFAPPEALRHPADALGRAPAAAIAAGSYLLAGQLAVPRPPRRPAGPLARGYRAVQISVSGAGALLVGGGSPEGGRVDVVVAEQPGVGKPGRTYVAAAAVRLLALEGPGGPGSDGAWQATLALTRGQALKLIAAENFARQVRLLPNP